MCWCCRVRVRRLGPHHDPLPRTRADPRVLVPERGWRAPIISEGVASGLSCVEYLTPPSDTPVELPWQDVARLTHRDQGGRRSCTAGRASSAASSASMGPETFARFYSYAAYTLDPALFALEFERFFGRSLNDAWAEVAAPHAAPTHLDAAMCPCFEPVRSRSTGRRSPSPSVTARSCRRFRSRLESDASVRLALSGIALTTIRNCWDHDRVNEYVQSDGVWPPSQTVPSGSPQATTMFSPCSRVVRRARWRSSRRDWLATGCGQGEPLRVDAGYRGRLTIRAQAIAAPSYAQVIVDRPPRGEGPIRRFRRIGLPQLRRAARRLRRPVRGNACRRNARRLLRRQDRAGTRRRVDVRVKALRAATVVVAFALLHAPASDKQARAAPYQEAGRRAQAPDRAPVAGTRRRHAGGGPPALLLDHGRSRRVGRPDQDRLPVAFPISLSLKRGP